MKIKISSLIAIIFIVIFLSIMFAENLTANMVIINKPNIIIQELNNELDVISNSKILAGVVSDSSKNNDVKITFDYSKLDYDDVNKLEVMKCSNWDDVKKSCKGPLTPIDSSIDRGVKEIIGDSKGSGVYFLVESRCGNGICEGVYGETSKTCSGDC